MLSNKTIILGVTGGIAAYKALDLCSALIKQHADVYVIMTKNAKQFVNPQAFSYLTKHKCVTDCFDDSDTFNIHHIELAKKADMLLIAPATADIISKIAGGIADDMLTTLCLSCDKPKYIAPAMNTTMYNNGIISDNIKKLQKYGYNIIQTDKGRLACGDVGKGKLAKLSVIEEAIYYQLLHEKDLSGKKITITSGPTLESIDPVRYITNHSSGKMGYALALSALRRGATINLISSNIPDYFEYYVQENLLTHIKTTDAQSMFEAVLSCKKHSDIIIMAAAVADFTPNNYSIEKIKKSNDILNIDLKRTTDILEYLGNSKKEGQKIVGFSMETNNLIENSKQKLINKNADMICANNINDEGAGFKKDTNKVTLLTKTDTLDLPLMSKYDISNKIFDKLLED